MKPSNLIGKKFGKLTVISREPSSQKGQTRWLCRCACGEERVFLRNHLQSGGSRSCGCSRVKTKGVKVRYSVYRQNAERRNLKFNLTYPQFERIVKQNCHYCGSSPSTFIKGSTAKHKESNYTFINGVDRVDNSLGYSKSNCVSCCTRCNVWKKNMGAEDFISHAAKIAQHQKKQKQEAK